MSSSDSPTLYILDLFSLVFQVFHGIPEMRGPQGQPTNAVFGLTRDLLNILKQKKPTHLVCAMDSPGQGQREVLFTDYKANRSAMPEELAAQLPAIAEMVAAFGVPQVMCPGWEADDVIATLGRQAVESDFDVYVVSNDKDIRQLLGPKLKIYYARKDTVMGVDELLLEWGIRPDQAIDFQAMVGDSVDNVPGIPQVGPKKATALLQQFGTLDELLARTAEISGAKLRETVEQNVEKALLSRELVRLRTDLPIEIDWDTARTVHIDVGAVADLCRQNGFRRFIDEVRSVAGALPEPPALEPARPKVEVTHRPNTFHIVDTAERLQEFAKELSQRTEFCMDLETTHLDPLQADIVGWAFSWEKQVGWYIPVRGPAGAKVLSPDQVAAALGPILGNPAYHVCNQNLKYDLLVLRRAGIEVACLGADSMVLSYLLDPGARGHGLDDLAEQHLAHRMIPIDDLLGDGLFRKRSMALVDIPTIAEYAVEDAAIAWELIELFRPRVEERQQWPLYWDLERPLIEVLVEMQANGLRVDCDSLALQSTGLAERLEAVRATIFELAGHEFNIDSPIQLRKVLFEELALPIVRQTKGRTGASTDQDVLEELAGRHPLPAALLTHRSLSKLKNTYLDALPTLVNPQTGKIHTSLNQVVAATGRLSSSEPNLQNIPVRTPEGQRIRQAFVASEPGWVLLSADYSQIELRMLAHLSGDATLKQAFLDKIDIHKAVAAQVFGIAADDVTDEQRRVAKAVNFGVIYGQSSFGLAASLGISRDEATRFIDGYFARYSSVTKFLDELLAEVARQGYARTILGRRRPISGIRSRPNKQRNLAERTAINSVIQGSAADLIKQAMVNVHNRLRKSDLPARMLLQIHDELLFEVRADAQRDLADLVRQEMEHALTVDVPITVEVGTGPNWLDLAPLV